MESSLAIDNTEMMGDVVDDDGWTTIPKKHDVIEQKRNAQSKKIRINLLTQYNKIKNLVAAHEYSTLLIQKYYNEKKSDEYSVEEFINKNLNNLSYNELKKEEELVSNHIRRLVKAKKAMAQLIHPKAQEDDKDDPRFKMVFRLKN